MIPRAPKGTDDILPPDSAAWRRVLRAFDDLAERYGYGLAMTPVFELTELFARGVGESTEVVEKQMYTFEDKGGRSVTLRPEATAGIVRAYAEAGRQGVFKAALVGPMFRYEQPQAGRRRQFFQVDVEYLGEAAALADVEVIELGYRLLREVGIEDATVLINSIGDAADREDYRRVLTSYLEERRSDLSPDAQARLETNPLRVLDSKSDAAVTAGAPVPTDHLSTEASEHYRAVLDGLSARGIPYEPAPRLVRGLDYYNRTVFEYISPSYTAAQGSLGGGGRYDSLSSMIGGPDVPAVGLAMGVDRIVLAMPSIDVPALDAFVVVIDESRRAAAITLVGELRDAGLRADSDLAARSVKAQFKAADRRGAARVVVVGDEWDDGFLKVKDMDGGQEENVSIREVATWLKR